MPVFLRPTFTCFARVAARSTPTIRIRSAEISESIAAVVRMADIAREARWRKREIQTPVRQQAPSNEDTKSKTGRPGEAAR